MVTIDVNLEVANYFGLVEKIIKSEYRGVLSYMEYDDLLSHGLEGLWIGVKSYNGLVQKEIHYSQNIRMKIGKEVSRSIERKQRETANDFSTISITNRDGIDMEYSSTTNDYDGVIMTDTLQRAFDSLGNDTERLILSMMIEGYKQADIAQEVGISQQAISKKIRVLRDKLKSQLY